ncbi:hypothetical protein O181_017472 [Austropuccinia psidii MF-1]|uniref:Uncharacterized protein n=1 Tax=Austropuccinia psidii MF-1 TaxID=1389203 RepID=A0A9Q3C5Y6_9BASI|nr:hypothetical protein [Austropuccinia psidii MF-1]
MGIFARLLLSRSLWPAVSPLRVALGDEKILVTDFKISSAIFSSPTIVQATSTSPRWTGGTGAFQLQPLPHHPFHNTTEPNKPSQNQPNTSLPKPLFTPLNQSHLSLSLFLSPPHLSLVSTP